MEDVPGLKISETRVEEKCKIVDTMKISDMGKGTEAVHSPKNDKVSGSTDD